ncbi:MAG: alpha-ketoacid dehydrogenase subunit beta [Paracoccaceae bacterium]|nr:alpha-ketoacid dehydrogenase subunit beta [Paracoccaceae bacterium]MDE2915433.1 alpha-ketoacid dehydrogenase subunit beta [Paracoccaceae bacterium]
MPRMRIIQAVNQALAEEMERDPKVIVIGEDVRASIFGDTRGLFDRFGPDRVRDTPISEAAMTGLAVGASACGYRIVLHMMFANFLYTGFDAIANQMAKLRLMTGGQVTLPITIIANYGGGRSTAAQHSDTPFSPLMNLGGIEVAVPSSPKNAKGLMKTAVRSDNPTVYLEPGGRGGELGEVPDGDYVTPFGQADQLQEGHELSLVTMGSMTRMTARTAKTLEKAGVSVDVLDMQTLVPLDMDAVLASAERTGRVIIVDESRDRCSAASHIAAVLADKAHSCLKAPVRRITVPDTAMPYAPSVERPLLPNSERIVRAAGEILGREFTT